MQDCGVRKVQTWQTRLREGPDCRNERVYRREEEPDQPGRRESGGPAHRQEDRTSALHLRNLLQVMDMENYQTFETPMPDDEDLKKLMASGIEVEYWAVMGRNMVVRRKG